MADENPYKVVVEALAAQSAAIARLAKEVKVEFAQYQDAVSKRDNARANRLAAAINERTAKLTEATEALAASVPNAEVGGGPAEPPSTPDQGLPGDQPGIDNTLPGRDRPVDPGFGVDEGGRPVAPDQPPSRPDRPDQGLPPGGSIDNDLPSGGRPDAGLPPGQGRPDQGLPEAPGRPPTIGGGPSQGPGRPDNTLPGEEPGVPERPEQGPPPVVGGGPVTPPNRPGQGLPGENPDVPDRPEQGLPPRPGNRPPGSGITRPGQGLPDGEGEAGNPLPDEGAPTLDYLAPSTARVGQEIIFTVSGDGFRATPTAYIDGEPATKTTYVNVNQVRVTETFSSAGEKQVTVDGSEPLTLTVS